MVTTCSIILIFLKLSIIVIFLNLNFIVNLFIEFKIVKTAENITYLLLAHGNFISVYDIANERWVKHTQY